MSRPSVSPGDLPEDPQGKRRDPGRCRALPAAQARHQATSGRPGFRPYPGESPAVSLTLTQSDLASDGSIHVPPLAIPWGTMDSQVLKL